MISIQYGIPVKEEQTAEAMRVYEKVVDVKQLGEIAAPRTRRGCD